MKYIIDIEDEPFTRESDGEKLYLSQYTPVIFAERELHFLTPYDESEAEKRGQEEAWTFAQKILAPPDNNDALTVEDLGNCYGTDDAYDVVCGTTYQEASERYEAWKKQKDELKIGDEVMHDTHRRCVLLEKKDVCEAELWSVIDEKGVVHQINRKHIHRKTGRTFPEVAELLEKMRNPDVDH